MPRASLAYAAMRRALLEVVVRVPHGRVVDATSLGDALNIPSRYVGSILAKLTSEEEAMVPWHRVIPRGGRFERPERRSPRHQRQLHLLLPEGHRVDGESRLLIDAAQFWTPAGIHRNTIWADVNPDTVSGADLGALTCAHEAIIKS